MHSHSSRAAAAAPVSAPGLGAGERRRSPVRCSEHYQVGRPHAGRVLAQVSSVLGERVIPPSSRQGEGLPQGSVQAETRPGGEKSWGSLAR